MEEYITYHKIINFMEQVQQASPRLKSFGHGDIVYFSENTSGTTTIYPYMFVTPIQVSYDENITTYQLNILFADIVNTDLSNEIDVVSDMSLEARNMLSQIRRGFLFDELDVLLPATATPFMERFNDHVGGVSLDMTITVFEDINACEMYATPNPTPTVTPTPTSTSTPTPTSTSTPTPTLTPTPTPSVVQYLTGVRLNNNVADFHLWQNSGHTITAQAICNITIGFNILGSLGGTASTTTVMATNDHHHNVNINSLIPGENLVSVTITSVTPSCANYTIIY